MNIDNELVAILDKYAAEGRCEWSKEPLDGDEVDTLVEILRAKLNLLNGNVSDFEYAEGERK